MAQSHIFTVMFADFEGELHPCKKAFYSLDEAKAAITLDLVKQYEDMGVWLPKIVFKEDGNTWTFNDEYENLYKIHKMEIC